MKTLRILLAVGLLGAATAAAVFLSMTPEPAAPAEARQFTHPAQCAECHREIAREASESYHGRAFTDPEVLALSGNFQEERCISCHAPAPIFQTGVGGRVFERKEGRETGVNCLSCHLLPSGGVAGTRGLAGPCRPEREPRLKVAEFCAGCHNQHWTVDEYLASAWAREKTCNDCHMPRSDRPIADGGPVRPGVASHRFPGSHEPRMLKEAVVLSARAENGRLEISVENRGAGHKIPTDSRHKSFNVYVSLSDEDGNPLLDRQEIAEYRLYYREQNIDSTQILPGETRSHTFELPAGRRGTARVELVYCQKPPKKDSRDWTPVHEVTLGFGDS